MAGKVEVTVNGTMVVQEEHDLDLVTKALSRPSPCMYEDVIATMGNFGKFQFIQLSLCILAFLPSAIMGIGFVFIGLTPHHVCNAVNETEVLSRYGLLNDSTSTVSYGSCEMTVSSNQSGTPRNVDSFSCPHGRNFTGGKHLTLVSQWDLVCESMGMAELGQALFIAGQIVGGFFLAPVADRIGRKWAMVCSSIACAFIEFSIAFSPNIYTVWGLLFIDGVIFIGFNATLFVLGLEYLRPGHRVNFGIVLLILWTVFALYVGLLGYIFQDIGWRYFQAAGAVSGAVLFVYPCFLCESPRWLASKNRPEEALAILKKACHQNGVDFSPVKKKFMEYVESLHPKSQGSTSHNVSDGENGIKIVNGEKVNYTALDLLRHRYALIPLCVSWYLWITNNITYYGIYMTSTSLSGNKYVNFCVLVLVEIPSNLTILYLLKRVNRLTVLRVFLLMSTVCLLSSSLIQHFFGDSPNVANVSTALLIAGKFAITASFNALYIYTPEIFPTVVRSSAFGACKGVARVGSLLAPYFRPLYEMVQWAPGVIFSVMCVIALFLVHFLPETKDTILPTCMQEMKQRLKKKRDTR